MKDNEKTLWIKIMLDIGEIVHFKSANFPENWILQWLKLLIFEVKSDDHYLHKEVRKHWPMKAFDL